MVSDRTVKQCPTCPWRIGCDPVTDIPNYDAERAAQLVDTIGHGLEEALRPIRKIMACHYSKPGKEFACAGWLHNQLGAGNNIAVRVDMLRGRYPIPIVEGEQHERYEDTLPCTPCSHPAHRRGSRGGLRKEQEVCMECGAVVLRKRQPVHSRARKT